MSGATNPRCPGFLCSRGTGVQDTQPCICSSHLGSFHNRWGEPGRKACSIPPARRSAPPPCWSQPSCLESARTVPALPCLSSLPAPPVSPAAGPGAGAERRWYRSAGKTCRDGAEPRCGAAPPNQHPLLQGNPLMALGNRTRLCHPYLGDLSCALHFCVCQRRS